MPKQTFYNLPAEKRERLLAAVREELSRAGVDGLSINRVVQGAGISRGSFYQYFEGKEDMLEYLLLSLRTGLLDEADGALEVCGGDIFRLFAHMFHQALALLEADGPYGFCRVLLADVGVSSRLFQLGASGAGESLAARYGGRLALEDLCIQGRQELEDLLGILLAITGEAMAQAFVTAQPPAQAEARYARRLALLRRGLARGGQAAQNEQGGGSAPCLDMSSPISPA